MGMFFFTKGVLHNGYIFRTPTHTSGHFILESPPSPPGVEFQNGHALFDTVKTCEEEEEEEDSNYIQYPFQHPYYLRIT